MKTTMILSIVALFLLFTNNGFCQLKDVRSLSEVDETKFLGKLTDDAIRAYNDTADQYIEPFRIFDNLYYVGVKFVSSFILESNDGLILIDALYGDQIQLGLSNIKRLGFNPANIKYVIVTHGHWDHVGGASFYQKMFGAKIIMTLNDWKLTYDFQNNLIFPMELPTLDLVAQDGDSLQLGETKLKFYVTPGHTEGVLSMEFEVIDGDKNYRAFTFGGVGLNFSGIEPTESYINSVKRISSISDDTNPIMVNIPNHPFINGFLKKCSLIKERKLNDPHPLINSNEFNNWLDVLLQNAENKLIEERAKRNK